MDDHRAAAVASRAICLALNEQPFLASTLAERVDDPPSIRTIRRILSQLESDNWLERRSNMSDHWYPGPLVRGITPLIHRRYGAEPQDDGVVPDSLREYGEVREPP